MGTTILALPKGISKAGIVLGLCVTALLGSVSCITCLIVVERGAAAGRSDFSGAVESYLGPRWRWVAWIFATCIIVGAAIVYHILMAETLYALVNTLAPSAPNHGWTIQLAALAPWAIYPICCARDLSLLVRFNSVGFIFMGFTMIFICANGVRALAGSGGGAEIQFRMIASQGAASYTDDGKFLLTTLAAPSFADLGGIVSFSPPKSYRRRRSIGLD